MHRASNGKALRRVRTARVEAENVRLAYMGKFFKDLSGLRVAAHEPPTDRPPDAAAAAAASSAIGEVEVCGLKDYKGTPIMRLPVRKFKLVYAMYYERCPHTPYSFGHFRVRWRKKFPHVRRARKTANFSKCPKCEAFKVRLRLRFFLMVCVTSQH